jgi:hypothetical protein
VVRANDPSRRYVFERWHGDWEFLSNPLSPTTTFKMPDRNCLHHGALQEDERAVSQSPSRTAGGNYVEIDRNKHDLSYFSLISRKVGGSSSSMPG